MNSSRNPLARREGLVIQEMPEEVLVYDTNTNKAHCLNKTAAFVWKSCDGSHTINDIAGLMEKEFGTNVPDDLVWLAIDQLGKDDLLEVSEIPAKGISRREVIRRIGIASVIALPVVASLVAPSSALAAVSCGCINPTACATQVGCASLVLCNGLGVCAP
jgi:Coenzyme PQQ synthesis protein D (PqqD)